MRPDPAFPLVFTLEMALTAGLTVRQAEGRVRSGAWHRLRRGCYCLRQTWQQANPEERHALMAAAAHLTRAGVPVVISHVSAAAVWGLPVPRRLLGVVVGTSAPGQGVTPRHDRYLIRQVARLDDEQTRRHRGLPVTSPARTVADCLRHLDAFDAVPIADAAIHRGLCRLADVVAVLEEQRGWPGSITARTSLELVDGRRESPLESRSVVVMHRHGIPMPESQVTILDSRGAFVARTDFAWLRYGVVGEADGRAKYAEGNSLDIFDAEKDRHALLDAVGLVVVRWNGRQLRGEPPPVVARLLAAFGRGDAERFTGRAA